MENTVLLTFMNPVADHGTKVEPLADTEAGRAFGEFMNTSMPIIIDQIPISMKAVDVPILVEERAIVSIEQDGEGISMPGNNRNPLSIPIDSAQPEKLSTVTHHLDSRAVEGVTMKIMGQLRQEQGESNLTTPPPTAQTIIRETVNPTPVVGEQNLVLAAQGNTISVPKIAPQGLGREVPTAMSNSTVSDLMLKALDIPNAALQSRSKMDEIPASAEAIALKEGIKLTRPKVAATSSIIEMPLLHNGETKLGGPIPDTRNRISIPTKNTGPQTLSISAKGIPEPTGGTAGQAHNLPELPKSTVEISANGPIAQQPINKEIGRTSPPTALPVSVLTTATTAAHTPNQALSPTMIYPVPISPEAISAPLSSIAETVTFTAASVRLSSLQTAHDIQFSESLSHEVQDISLLSQAPPPQPFAALGTLAAVSANQEPALARHMAAQIADIAQPLPSRPVELALNPEELGRIRLTFSSENGTLNIVVAAERPETIDLMRRHIDALAQELRSAGYRDVNFGFGQEGQKGEGSMPGETAGEDQKSLIQSKEPTEDSLENSVHIQPDGGSEHGVDIRI